MWTLSLTGAAANGVFRSTVLKQLHLRAVSRPQGMPKARRHPGETDSRPCGASSSRASAPEATGTLSAPRGESILHGETPAGVRSRPLESDDWRRGLRGGDRPPEDVDVA